MSKKFTQFSALVRAFNRHNNILDKQLDEVKGCDLENRNVLRSQLLGVFCSLEL